MARRNELPIKELKIFTTGDPLVQQVTLEVIIGSIPLAVGSTFVVRVKEVHRTVVDRA